MPGGRDNSSGRRPPPRKSWEEEEVDDQDSDSRLRFRDRLKIDEKEGQSPDLRRGGIRPPAKPNTSMSSPADAWGGKKKDEDEETKALKKTKRKKLYKLLASEALCLLIVFGMIGAFNWIANDYSGDYIGQTMQLRLVQLSLKRTAASVEADLTYGTSGLLELDQSVAQKAPAEGKTAILHFITPAQWCRARAPMRATFKGKIDNGKAVGTISDRTGTYKVSLSKNVLTSLFHQTSAHIPVAPAVPLPSLFHEQNQKQNIGPVQFDQAAAPVSNGATQTSQLSTRNKHTNYNQAQ